MCMAVYLAADAELPLIVPTDPPTFSVRRLTGGEAPIRDGFPAPLQPVALGSATGCGCGFHDAEDTASRQRLVDYLAALPATARIQIYSCWNGDEDEPEQEVVELPMPALLQADAWAERRRVIIRRT